MSEQQQNTGEVKTCPACGGTWAADRRACLACGASLESVPATPASEAPEHEPLNWRWLDALAPDDDAQEGPAEAEPERKWWQFWR
jgi:predicted amidophosphoribosyltransferase